MPTASIRTRGWKARSAAVLAGIAVVGGLAVMPASAAPEPVSTPVTGTMDINGNEFILDDAVVFTGTFDPDTGVLAGGLAFEGGTVTVDDPAATLTYRVEQPDPGAGTIDLDTGEATFDATLLLHLDTVDIGTGPIPLTPCSYLIPLALTGTYDQDASLLSLAETGFAMTANPADGDGRCAGLFEVIDAVLVSANNSIDTQMDLSVTDAVVPEPAPTPPPTPPAPPAPAPAPAPVVQPPTFTG